MDLRSPRPATTVRRNPPRRAKQTPAPSSTSAAVAVASAPSKPPSSNAPDPAKTSSFSAAAAAVASITPFPLHEILSPGPPTPVKPSPSPTAAVPLPLDAAPPESIISPPAASAAKAPPRLDNLKVFLRVRPLEVRPRAGKQQPGVRARGSKGLPPKGKGNDACLVVNDSGSVTLSGPSTPLDAKRTKSEVYDGFSHVFPPESSQKEVYERVMDPLVVDFMGGKGALLAAMGPSGSGKTHTMFGCPREPGMVPLVLQQIFSQSTDDGVPQPLRSYYLSMIEIYSERGKGERIFDLLPDGADLCLQQSVGKGHQEVIISNVAEAESLIARGMLKRSTAATNTNSQSSRSQCIINIRSSLGNINNGNDFPGNSAVLTIADLAGAEREKKTGNQGARLLESNFINNTSMVFGLCLRSLLEHQRNPKKPFEKHFKNSLLTRYLKEYMEGKKQMTLMLTVKPGEDDYLDTSFVLRQASPYMKIKYNNLEEIPSVPSQKRSNAIFIRSELPKRRKYNSSEPKMADGGRNHKAVIIEHQISEKDVDSGKQRESDTPENTNAYSKSDKTVQMDTQLSEERSDDLQRLIRNDMIMQGFAKALWNVLKQYKQKLEVSEKEVQGLKETVEDKCCQIRHLEEKLQVSEKEVQGLKETVEDKCCQIRHLEEKLKGQNSFCLCHKQSEKDSSNLQVDTCAFEPLILSAKPIDSKNVDLGVAANLTPLNANQECNGFKRNDFCQETLEELDNPEDNAQLDPSISSLQTCVLLRDAEHLPDCHGTLYEKKDTCVSIAEVVNTMDSSISTRDAEIQNHQLQLPENSEEVIPENRHLEELNNVQTRLSKEERLAAHGFMEDDKGILSQQNNEAAIVADVITKPELRASSDKDTRLNGKSQAGEIAKKEERDAPFKPSNGKMPRRRLMPASSMLLKGFSSLDIENDNPMENRNKRPAEGRERSEGSISLVHMIKSNLRK